jgi:hypothetical protein
VAGIGELNQTDLHEQLKSLYCADDGEVEVEVDGFIVDVRLPSGIVEIQTGNVGRLKRKLSALCASHKVRLVHPVAAIKYITRIDEGGQVLSVRRSPKRGRMEEAFRELSSIADLLPEPNLTVEIVMVRVTEWRRDDGRGSWRRKGISIAGRRLDEVMARHEFRSPADYLGLLPDGLPDTFTNHDFSAMSGFPYRVVQPITNTLRKMNLLTVAAKRARSLAYKRR